jgi:hypothetical protein
MGAGSTNFTGIQISGAEILPGVKGEIVTGNVFFVDSGSGEDQGPHGTKDLPFATTAYALDRCTANNNDMIVWFAGHAETITTANPLDFDIAGVTCVGLGSGGDRPKFTVSTNAAATVTISAASVKIQNVIFIAALDGLNTTVTVTGTDCVLDVEHWDTSSTVEADIAIACTGDRFVCKLRDVGFAAGDQRDQSITLTGVDGAKISIDFYGKVATAVVNMLSACTDVSVQGIMYVSGTTNGTKNVVDDLSTSYWFADIFDAAAGARYTGGSAAAFSTFEATATNTKVDSVGTQTTAVASQATSVATGVVSLGTQITANTSQNTSIATGAVSLGTQITANTSQNTSIATGTVSLGTQITANTSQNTSIATGAVSLGTQITANTSQNTSIATGTVSVGAQVLSAATSIGTGTSVINSQAISVATGVVSVGAQVLSGATSIGTGTSAIASQLISVAAGLALVLSIVTSKP